MIFRVVIFTALTYFVGANGWDNVKELQKCAQLGKKHWCSSPKQAEICQATRYCEEHIWSKAVKSDDIDVCASCKETVGVIHEYMNVTENQKGIIALAKHSCFVLPSTLQEMCMGLVEVYGNKLIKKVNNYLADPAKACKTFHLCGSDLLGPIYLPKKFGNDYCTSCQQFLGTVHLLIANKELQDEIIAELKSSCQYCPVEKLCSITWDFVAPPLLKSLEGYLSDPSKFCSLIHVCPSTKQLFTHPKDILTIKQHTKDILRFEDTTIVGVLPVNIVNPKTNNDICTTCEQTVGTIHLLISNKETQAEILNVMESGCQYLPGVAKELCTEVIESRGKQLIDAMVNYLADPSELCSLIHLCQNKSPASYFMDSKKVNQDICTTCEQTVGTIHMIMSNKETQAQILNVMESVCQYVPGAAKELCTELVKSKGQLFITAMVNYIADPSQLCSMIHLCQKTNQDTLFMASKEINADICTGCKETVGTVHSILASKETQEAMLIAMKAACQALPIAKELCVGFVEERGQELLTSLANALADPNALCTMIHLCSGSNPGTIVLTSNIVTATTQKKEVPASITCTFCQYAMGYLDSTIEDKKNEEKVKEALESLCEKLPEYLNSECVEYVKEYGNKVIDLLVQELNPSVVCHELGLCKGSKDNKQIQHMQALRMSLHGPSCTACEYVMGYMEKKLESKTALKEVENVINTICNYVPSTVFNVECNAIVSEYGDDILKLMWREYIKPDKICKAIRLCE